MNQSRSESGFTLVELLVSVAIFSLMTVVAYTGLVSIMNHDRDSLEHETALKKLQRSLVFIEKDLRQMTLRPRNTGYSELIPALKSDGGYDTGLMEFTRAGNSNPTDLNRSSLQRVRYVLEDNTLQRMSWNHVDHNDAEPLTMNLLTEVNEVSFAFLSAEGENETEWAKNELPLGIELKLTHEQWGNVRRVFPLYY
ncbi:type II secretion system minor pseudopilin GspJ [Leucothrix pacifica]|uniref:Type II secretion system protein J n=1 Tax=Leucothrix pacifica TaxID=1247513 RepID=A0A317CP39_9GAMM|nr:type II secretion system minor pseudopilin GspJ [Leucothrix pacifica]PWQ99977.1 type II secretion system protein GspJ [Leucothrix pacifica]